MMLQLILGMIYTMAFPLIADAATRYKGANVSFLGWIALVILSPIIGVVAYIFKAKNKKEAIQNVRSALNTGIDAMKELRNSRHSERDK